MGKRGGGVMVYIKETICSSQLRFNSFTEFESVMCKINLSTGDFVGLLCIYRPPNITDIGDFNLVNLIERFMGLNFSCNLITGDFNMPMIDWNSFSAPPRYNAFLKCCSKHFLNQHIKESTRPNSNAILDLILSSVGTNISDVSVNECFGLSDHSIINFTLSLPCMYDPTLASPVKSLKRNYNKADWNQMSQLLAQVDWDSIFNNVFL